MFTKKEVNVMLNTILLYAHPSPWASNFNTISITVSLSTAGPACKDSALYHGVVQLLKFILRNEFIEIYDIESEGCPQIVGTPDFLLDWTLRRWEKYGYGFTRMDQIFEYITTDKGDEYWETSCKFDS